MCTFAVVNSVDSIESFPDVLFLDPPISGSPPCDGCSQRNHHHTSCELFLLWPHVRAVKDRCTWLVIDLMPCGSTSVKSTVSVQQVRPLTALLGLQVDGPPLPHHDNVAKPRGLLAAYRILAALRVAAESKHGELQNPAARQSNGCTGDAAADTALLEDRRPDGGDRALEVLAFGVGGLLKGVLGAVGTVSEAEDLVTLRRLTVEFARAAVLCGGAVAAHTGAALWEVARSADSRIVNRACGCCRC